MFNNLGNIYWESGFINETKNVIRMASQVKTNHPKAFKNLKDIRLIRKIIKKDKIEFIISLYKKAIEIDPKLFDAHHNIAILNLYCGDIKEGWKNFFFRWHLRKFNTKKLKFDKPKFNLSSNYHHVFIWKEQGIGDQILFARLFNDLRDKDIKIDALVDKKLKPLFQSSFPHSNFVDSANEDLIDSHAPMGDLGQFFINNFDDVKARSHPYIKVNQQRTETLKKLLLLIKRYVGYPG